MKSRKASLSKTTLLAMIILSVALILGLAQQSSAVPTTYYVDDDTCPGTGSGTSVDPYCKIQDGIDAAAPGDTVSVAAGTYNEGITMNDGVDVLGADPNPAATSITGSAGEPGKAAVVIFSSASGGAWTTGATLKGFKIGYTGGGAGAGIFVEGSTTDVVIATIDNCIIDNNPAGAGVRLNGLVQATIQNNCTITRNTKAGIVTRAAAQPDLLEDGSIVTISGSTIGGAGLGNKFGGIILNGVATPSGIDVTINGNTISDNTRQSVDGPGGAGIRLWRINSVNIASNTISNNDRGGIVLIDVAAGQIADNDISGHATEAGINIGGASSSTAPGLTIGPDNDIFDNLTGIAFYVELNPSPGLGPTYQASYGNVTIGGTDKNNRNLIHSNTKAGIAVIDPLADPSSDLKIQFNLIYSNTEGGGIAFFNQCTADIWDNEIHTHAAAAGIFTGDWSESEPPPGGALFNTANGPAMLTIRRNKVYGNNLAGMRLDHASGTISNNLVYSNDKAGIRFSGGDITDSPLGVDWGITAITNNTVAVNGSGLTGGGIVYDDISDTSLRLFDGPPQGSAWDSTYMQTNLLIENNISANNVRAGIRVGCDAGYLDSIHYNLLYNNFGFLVCDPTGPIPCVLQQLGGYCWDTVTDQPPPGVIFADPDFVAEYQLNAGSPAIDAGDPAENDLNDGTDALYPSLGGPRIDMGCYGGPDPMTWNLP